jgi:hypothetical protein
VLTALIIDTVNILQTKKNVQSTSLTLRVIISWKQEASIPTTATGVTEARTQAAEMKAFRKTATTLTELTDTLSLLTAGTDAPGHCQRRDRATDPRRLRSARLPVNTVTELTGTLSSMPAITNTPGHCHWLDCVTNPRPLGTLRLPVTTVTELTGTRS